MRLRAVVTAFVLIGCGAEPASKTAKSTFEHAPARPALASAAASSALKAPGEARVGDRTMCMVSNEEFVVTESSPKVDYEGKTYYFCCKGCDTDFKKDPEKYLHKSP